MTYRLALPGERYAYKRVKSDAAAARRDFKIPFEWFAAACHLPCEYCGRSDQNTISVKSRSMKGGWIVKDFKYNGLDRKDNDKGYSMENCVPCCAVCNRGKNSMGYNEWMEYLDTLMIFRLKGKDNSDDYQPRHVRDVSLPVSGRDSQAGDASEIKYAQGGYVLEDGASGRRVYNDRFILWPRMVGKPQLYKEYFQEEEPKQN